MHYPNKAFSVNGGVTLARKGCGSRTTGECQLGQYNGFSASDVKGLNILYGCSDTGTGGGGGGGGEDCVDKNTNCPNWAKKCLIERRAWLVSVDFGWFQLIFVGFD